MTTSLRLFDRFRIIARFLYTVVGHFLANKGLLLAGGIAFYALLSIIPVLVLIFLILSSIIDQQSLLDTLNQYLVLIAPNTADTVILQVQQVLDSPDLIGGIGIISLFLFSGLAFRVVNDAMQVIFSHRREVKKRHTVTSLAIPYIFVFAIAAAIGVIVISGSAYAAIRDTSLMQYVALPDHHNPVLSFLLGLFSEAILFMSFYQVMPVGKTPWKLAILGGISAALLWECLRQFLLIWYGNISNVNMIYGTFASVILLLLMIEAGAVILLLGAQVIADYERIFSVK